MSVAKSDDGRCTEVSPFVGNDGKQQIAEKRNDGSHRCVVRYASLAQGFAAGKSGYDKRTSQNQKEIAAAAFDAQSLLSVNGHIGGNDAIRQTKTGDIRGQTPTRHQKESIERQRLATAYKFPFGHFDACSNNHSQGGHTHGNAKKYVEVVRTVINPHRNRWTDGRGDIVA